MTEDTLPDELTEGEWLARRKEGLGGTDVAAIVGVHPWRSPLDVYAEKLGLVDPQPTNVNMRYGSAVEGFVLDEYGRETGQRVIRLGRRMWKHKDIVIWQGTPDGLVVDGPGVEAKTVSFSQRSKWGDELGSDDVPQHVRCQVTWYAPLLEREIMDVAVWFSGVEFSMYRVPRETALVEALSEAAQRFWRDHIIAEVPPPLDASKAAEAYLKKMFPANALGPKAATPEEEILLLQLWNSRMTTKIAKDMEDTLENQVKAIIGEHEGIETERIRALWKRTKDGVKVDWEAVVGEIRRQLDVLPHDVPFTDSLLDEIVQQHTAPKPGVRRFTFNVKE